MNNIPDFTKYGYRIVSELGRNREGGRITWKGIDLANQATVVIKQFCFATTGSTWSGYKAYEQEIKLLQQLDHPGIPRYLATVETDDGFCLIQEYKNATSLAQQRNLTLEQVEKIIIKILEILVYLQQQTAPIFHRDLKPENILVDEELNTYLIDFGFAKLGNQAASASSVFKGTPGFIPPEQIIQPTTASDLYSLGVTIICLLTGKQTAEIQAIATTNNPYLLKFKPLLPSINRKFLNWLAKMVEPQANKRYQNAAAALSVLPPLTKSQPQSNLILFNLKQPVLLGLVSLFVVSGTMVLGIKSAIASGQQTIADLAIALIGAVVVAIAQQGAVIMSMADKQAKTGAMILAISVPTIVVIAAIIILGGKGALSMTAAVIAAEGFTLAYVLAEQLAQRLSHKVTIISLLLISGLGMAMGLGISQIWGY